MSHENWALGGTGQVRGDNSAKEMLGLRKVAAPAPQQSAGMELCTFHPGIVKTAPAFLCLLCLPHAKYLKGDASNLHGKEENILVVIECALENGH